MSNLSEEAEKVISALREGKVDSVQASHVYLGFTGTREIAELLNQNSTVTELRLSSLLSPVIFHND